MKLTISVITSAFTNPVWVSSRVIPESFIQRAPNTFSAYQMEPTTMLDKVARMTAM